MILRHYFSVVRDNTVDAGHIIVFAVIVIYIYSVSKCVPNRSQLFVDYILENRGHNLGATDLLRL